MTGFKPGDRVQHHTGVEGTVTRCNGKFATVDWDHYVLANIHHVDLLTPLGEPMSKRTDFLDADGSPMTIEGQADHENWAIKFASTYREFTPADAPALALAILEAAGVEAVPFDEAPETEAGHAAWVLRHHVQASEEAAKEAADQKELETEALTLCRVMWDNSDQQWEPMSPKAKTMWLVMARTAREMYNR